MTNKKSTKKALLTSALSLILCLSMLVGTTFAWFTDEVKSGTNIIAAGNLDIELYHSDKAVKDEKVNGGTKLFDDVMPSLWEPGAVAYEVLTVKNEGTLALKYNLAVMFKDATRVNGKTLADALWVAVVDSTKLNDRESAIAAGEGKWQSLADFDLPGTLEAGKSDTYGIVIYWLPTDNDNDFNMNNENQGKTLSIELGVHLTATQLMSENDSYGPDYDGDALICDIVATPDTLDEIMANAEPGTVIGLASGRYDPISIPKDGLTLVTNDALTDSLNLNGHNDITIDGIEFQSFYKQIPVSTYDRATASFIPTGNVASITNTTSTSHGSNNIVIRNCRFYCNPAWVGQGYGENYVPNQYCAINFEDAGRVSGPSTNITIENCSFEAASFNHIRLSYVDGEVVIRNNKFVAPSSHHNINATGNKANWTITGNTFSSWADGEYAFGTGRDAGPKVMTIKITNNTFNKALAAGETTPVLSIKNKYTAENSVIIVENNVFNAGAATIGEREADGKYWMTAEETTVGEYADLFAALKNGEDVALVEDVNNNKQKVSNGQGATAYTQNGGVFDGNGHTLTATGLGGTWDSAIYTKGGTIKNVVIEGAMRGIFIDSTSAGAVYLENVTSNCVYTINCNRGGGNGLVAVNCSFNGWTSFAASIGNVKFVDCSFGAGSGYNKSVPYATTEYIGCDFAEGHVIDAQGAITFENCTINGQPLTAENLATLVVSGIANATVK